MRNEGNVSGSTFFHPENSPLISQTADGHPLPENNKILICSSDPDTGILLKTILELWGFQTLLSASVEQSVADIETGAPKLIMLDSVLPFATHLENIRRIRRHKISKRIPIVVISGFSMPHFKNLSIDAGANDFLVKPLDFDVLENYLKRLIEMPSTKTI